MTEVPARPTVLDATALSNFAYLDQISRLQILSRPVVPAAVRAEVEVGADDYPFLTSAIDSFSETLPVVTFGNESTAVPSDLTDTLDRGEAEAFAIGESHHGLLVTDDGAARGLARERDVRFTGTIGILIRLIDEGEIDERTGDRWLKRLVDETDYRAPSRDLSAYLSE